MRKCMNELVYFEFFFINLIQWNFYFIDSIVFDKSIWSNINVNFNLYFYFIIFVKNVFFLILN